MTDSTPTSDRRIILWRGVSRPAADHAATASFVGVVTVPVPPWTEIMVITATEFDRLARADRDR